MIFWRYSTAITSQEAGMKIDGPKKKENISTDKDKAQIWLLTLLRYAACADDGTVYCVQCACRGCCSSFCNTKCNVAIRYCLEDDITKKHLMRCQAWV